MPLQIVRNDITKMEVDAIVNAANETLLGGGGVDGAIHRAAGKQLLRACRKLGGCKTGEAKITLGYNLPAKYVIHTVGPVWHGGNYNEADLLVSCYWKSLHLAKANNCETIAFPLISSGAYGYPKEQAFRIAVNTIKAFLEENDMLVYIVVFDSGSYIISLDHFFDVARYIDQHYVDEHTEYVLRDYPAPTRASQAPPAPAPAPKPVGAPPRPSKKSKYRAAPPAEHPSPSPIERLDQSDVLYTMQDRYEPLPCAPSEETYGSTGAPGNLFTEFSLNDALNCMDIGFSEALLRKIDEKGITDAACYKRANIDRKLFSKIRNDKDYKPSKRTAVALCIALELDFAETTNMLARAGIALTHSCKFDIIIEYFISRRNFDIFEINETLLCFDQPLLGV